jgi:hypothetical protein
MDLITRHCSACGAERLFERPPCLGGHGDECPEWACVGCGTAILVDPFLTDPLLGETADRRRRLEHANAPAGSAGGRRAGSAERAPSQAA